MLILIFVDCLPMYFVSLKSELIFSRALSIGTLSDVNNNSFQISFVSPDGPHVPRAVADKEPLIVLISWLLSFQTPRVV